MFVRRDGISHLCRYGFGPKGNISPFFINKLWITGMNIILVKCFVMARKSTSILLNCEPYHARKTPDEHEEQAENPQIDVLWCDVFRRELIFVSLVSELGIRSDLARAEEEGT